MEGRRGRFGTPPALRALFEDARTLKVWAVDEDLGDGFDLPSVLASEEHGRVRAANTHELGRLVRRLAAPQLAWRRISATTPLGELVEAVVLRREERRAVVEFDRTGLGLVGCWSRRFFLERLKSGLPDARGGDRRHMEPWTARLAGLRSLGLWDVLVRTMLGKTAPTAGVELLYPSVLWPALFL